MQDVCKRGRDLLLAQLRRIFFPGNQLSLTNPASQGKLMLEFVVRKETRCYPTNKLLLVCFSKQ